MTKNNTVEKIDEIIIKINNSEELSDKEARKLLRGIDEDLAEIEENIEEKHEEKLKELRKEIDKSLSQNSGWGRIKTLLNDDVKDDLVELKNEIVKSEETSLTIAVVENKLTDDVISLREEIAKWRVLFPNQTPEQASENLKKFASKLEKERYEYKGKLDVIQAKLETEAKKTGSNSMLDASKDISKFAQEYVELGSKVGKDSGFGVIFQPIGAIIGVGAGVYHGTIETGVNFAERMVDTGKELTEKGVGAGIGVLEGTAQHGEKIGAYLIDTSLKAADGTAQHVEGVGKYLIDTSVTVADGAAQYGVGILEGAKDLIEGLAGTRSEKERVKILEEKLVEREKLYEEKLAEKEKRVNDLTEDKEGKNQEIKELKQEIRELKERIRELEKKLDSSQDRLFAQVEEVAKIRSSSPLPLSAHDSKQQ